jgi:hypothetical protein
MPQARDMAWAWHLVIYIIRGNRIDSGLSPNRRGGFL